MLQLIPLGTVLSFRSRTVLSHVHVAMSRTLHNYDHNCTKYGHGALTRAFIKCIFISAPRGLIGAKLSSLHNSINFNIYSSNQFAIFRYRTSVYHARQTIIMRTLYSVMANAHALERFCKHSHCTVGPFWNGNFCRSILERFGRERSR